MFSEEFTIKLLIIALVIYGTSLHEMAHAFVATWLGDPTPGRAGRLTLNPLPHLDPPFTAIFLPALMFFTSGGLLGLAQTPVDPSRFRHPLRDHALVALAGPGMNLLFTAVMIAILWVPSVSEHSLAQPWVSHHGVLVPLDLQANQTTVVLVNAALWNLILGVFNLLPIPPLDGYWFLRAGLPLSIRRHTDAFARMGLASMALVLVGGSFLLGVLIPLLGRFFWFLLPA